MVKKVYESHIAAPVQKVWDFHRSADALKLLTPPGQHVRVLSTRNEVVDGALHILEIKPFGPFKTVWKARISNVQPPHSFTDTAEQSPFKSWHHVHEFIDDEGETILRDTITYEPPGWILRNLVNTLFVSDRIDEMFRYRHKTTKDLVESEPVHVNEELFSHHDLDESSQHIT